MGPSRLARRKRGNIFPNMLTLILALIIVFIAIGIIGFVVHGLFWLFIIAIVLFLATLVLGGRHAGSRRRRL
jgi:phosphatidylglycerophosphate synthase